MSDRTYARFTIPTSALANAIKAEAVRLAIGLTADELLAIMMYAPEPDDASGYGGTTVRLVDGRPCVVHEDSDANYGGTHIETALTAAGVPFIQVNGAGDEYGPSSTVFDGCACETIRLSHDLAPVVGIDVIDGRITLDQQEIRDVERYSRLRQAALQGQALAT